MAEENFAEFRVTLEGRDLTSKIAPRLISLQLSEKRGDEADQLDIVIHDHDGAMSIPKAGAMLRLQLGWVRGAGVAIGLVDKGSFKVDEAEWSGPPDVITVRGRSADFTSGFRIRQEKSYRETTLGQVVRDVAARQGLQASVAPELAAIPVPVLGQDRKSDMALVRELGRRHDAVATVKAGKLIFSPIGSPVTPGGLAIPAGTLIRRDGDKWTYRRVDRGNANGVEARWRDQDAAERKTVTVGGSGTGKPKRLKKVFGTEAEARSAAEAEARRMKRATAEFDYDCALGRPDLYPDRPITVSGFKPEIDAQRWLIAEATHTLDANGGLQTKLKLETAG